MSWKDLFFSFRGRISRGTYWRGIAIVACALLVIFGVIVLFSSEIPWEAVLFVVLLPVLFAALALGAKRLHDRDKSAWWLVLFYLVPRTLARLAESFDDFAIVLWLVVAAISIWALVEIGFLRGTPGTNRYGPDPLGRRPDAAVPITH